MRAIALRGLPNAPPAPEPAPKEPTYVVDDIRYITLGVDRSWEITPPPLHLGPPVGPLTGTLAVDDKMSLTMEKVKAALAEIEKLHAQTEREAYISASETVSPAEAGRKALQAAVGRYVSEDDAARYYESGLSAKHKDLADWRWRGLVTGSWKPTDGA